jgi:hypothetical protein
MKTITLPEPPSPLGQTLVRIMTHPSVSREVAALAADAMASDLRLEQWFEDSVKGRVDAPEGSAERILSVWYDVEEEVGRAWDDQLRHPGLDTTSLATVLRKGHRTMVELREHGVPDQLE